MKCPPNVYFLLCPPNVKFRIIYIYIYPKYCLLRSPTVNGRGIYTNC